MQSSINKLFEKSGLSISEVAKRCDISFTTAKRYLNEELERYRPQYVEKIVKILNEEIDSKEIHINVEEIKESIHNNSLNDNNAVNITVKRGDIFYIKNKTNDGIWGSRPGIVVSSDKLNNALTTVEVVFVTTKPKQDIPTHASVKTRFMSTALCEQINTVSKDRLMDYMGSVTDVEMTVIEHALLASLGISCGGTSRSLDYVVMKTERNMYEKFYTDLLKLKI